MKLKILSSSFFSAFTICLFGFFIVLKPLWQQSQALRLEERQLQQLEEKISKVNHLGDVFAQNVKQLQSDKVQLVRSPLGDNALADLLRTPNLTLLKAKPVAFDAQTIEITLQGSYRDVLLYLQASLNRYSNIHLAKFYAQGSQLLGRYDIVWERVNAVV